MRLIAASPLPEQSQWKMFQFQIGAIDSKLIPFYVEEVVPFQFQIGAIDSLLFISVSPNYICFNSRLVRLIVQQVQSPLICNRGFNSRLVRLIGVAYALGLPSFCSFNSRLVRLIDKRYDNISNVIFVFQFQIGAIDRIDSTVSLSSLWRFQFQIGAIDSVLSFYCI